MQKLLRHERKLVGRTRRPTRAKVKAKVAGVSYVAGGAETQVSPTLLDRIADALDTNIEGLTRQIGLPSGTLRHMRPGYVGTEVLQLIALHVAMRLAKLIGVREEVGQHVRRHMLMRLEKHITRTPESPP